MSKVSLEYKPNISYFTKEGKSLLSEMIIKSFRNLELDKNNYGTEGWNPLGDNLIKEGDTVLVKPNMVLDQNPNGLGEECLYTNPSIIECILPYICKALKGKGKIIVADAPVQSCDFETLIKKSGYKDLIQSYSGEKINIELKDLRGLISKYENGVLKQKINDNDKNAVEVNLEKYSEYSKMDKNDIEKLRITNYNPSELLKHHNEDKHEYLIAKEALEADVIINIPKPKSHRIAGVTLGLKNFVGVNVRKEYLPHHRIGDIKHGGDEHKKPSILLEKRAKLLDKANVLKSNKQYARAKILLKISAIYSIVDRKLFSKDKNRDGSWYGNDTIWRTIIDINKIIRYADKNGIMKDSPQRKIFNIADMIVIGEKEGPLRPSPKYAGMIAMGRDIVPFDEILATLLGFDINKIPLYKHIREKRKYKIVDEEQFGMIVSSDERFNNKTVKDIRKNIAINIEPTSGWKNHIELEK